MYLARLALANFRNYAALELSLEPGLTIFVGENGQGKTNLFESIYFLATTRSQRTSDDRELISWQASSEPLPFARLEGSVRRETEVHLSIVLREDRASNDSGPASAVSTVIKVDGLPVRATQLFGRVNVVSFSPEDIALADGPPAGRRRYLDITNSQIDQQYLRSLQRFNRVLAQRNQLLRQIRDGRQRRETLEFWSEELVVSGTYVTRRRMEMVHSINSSLGALYAGLSGQASSLQLAYRATAAAVSDEPNAGQLAYRARLAEMNQREVEAGLSLVGPHRDDFSFLLDGIDLQAFGSRGQQRLAVLALKLAETQYMNEQNGQQPILMLDDVLSELDEARRQLVLEQVVHHHQTLITTTDLRLFSPHIGGQAAVYSVRAGQLEQAGSAPSAAADGSADALARANSVRTVRARTR